jgi:hypothetical protein
MQELKRVMGLVMVTVLDTMEVEERELDMENTSS